MFSGMSTWEKWHHARAHYTHLINNNAATVPQAYRVELGIRVYFTLYFSNYMHVPESWNQYKYTITHHNYTYINIEN